MGFYEGGCKWSCPLTWVSIRRASTVVIYNVNVISFFLISLQRLLPIDGGHEVFSLRAPEVPTTCISTIRPYQPNDEVQTILMHL